MLPWVEIQRQIEAYVEKRREREDALAAWRSRFVDLLQTELRTDWQRWKQLAAHAPDHLVPDFDESPGAVHTVHLPQTGPILLAGDGSQIFPSHHEIAPLALIHVSRIRLDYAHPDAPALLETRARLCLEDEENNDVTTDHKPAWEDRVSDLRTLEEARSLAALAVETRERYKSASGVPILALMDGSLVLWRLAARAFQPYEAGMVAQYLESLDRFFDCRVPVAGYISHSGSREVVQLLSLVWRELDGAESPPTGEVSPSTNRHDSCEPLLTDAQLFSSLLRAGQRSAVFHSRSKILRSYRQHTVSYFYLHVGEEVARVEAPRWVMDDPDLLNTTASLCLHQARLGGGYPVILSEAHEQAVIRGPDRETFFALLEQEMWRRGYAPHVSPKQFRKRSAIL